MHEIQREIIKTELREILEYLEGHPLHDSRLAWNIKVYSPDTSGRSGDCHTDKKWNPLWDLFVEKDQGFFWLCCEDGLGFTGDKESRQFNWNDGIPEIEGCDYELWQAGRCGGWLELHSFDGGSLDIDEAIGDIKTCLESEDPEDPEESGCPRDFLVGDSSFDYYKKLIIFSKSLDEFDATEEWNHQCNFQRYLMEEKWDSGDFSDFDDNELAGISNTHPGLRGILKDSLQLSAA